MKLDEIGFYSLSDERIKNVSETSQMKRCEMIITNKCNFSCPYCRPLNASVYQLSLEEIKKNIDLWCKNIPLENIRFSGGEPTLHKDIIEIIKYSKEKGIKRIAISTNGSNNLTFYKSLIDNGCNDFSISLDGCCSSDVKMMSGGKDCFDIISNNIKELSKLTYVTVGIVLTENNINHIVETIIYADSLGVSDIRIISSSQTNKDLSKVIKIGNYININKYPILKYRINNLINGRNVRGLKELDSNKCGLVFDDSVIAGNYHYPCIIYMREGGNPIGKVSDNMRNERIQFFNKHNTHKDQICRNNCLDVCIDYNNCFKKKYK